MSNKNVNLSVSLPFIGFNCTHERSGCRLGPTFVVNALNFSLSSLLWQWPSDAAGL